jgi:hypothetical protein
MTETALAAAAALVATAFALSTWERWLVRRRRHELAWSVALTLFALASLALWAGAATGWRPATFRAFYLLGAIVNVPYLAVGSVYLVAGRRAGDRAAVAATILAVFAAGVLVAAPLTGPIDPDELPRGSDVFGPLPRVLAAGASAGGALVVFAGAAWSVARRHNVVANALIAAGVVVLSGSGLLNSALGEMRAFSVTLAIGVAVLFAGFLVATVPRPAAVHRRPDSRLSRADA